MDSRCHKACFFARNRKITTGDKLTTGGSRHTFNSGNNRLRQGDDRFHNGRTSREDVFEVNAPAIGIGAMRSHFFEIMTG